MHLRVCRCRGDRSADDDHQRARAPRRGTRHPDRIRKGEEVEPYETVRLRKDGRRAHVWLTVSPVRDAEGTIVGTSTIARDITERRMAEIAARQLVAIVESSDDAILSKTLDGIIMSWNAGAERPLPVHCRRDGRATHRHPRSARSTR
jgi:PAS domain-containing protein